jgi:hypothetical protein
MKFQPPLNQKDIKTLPYSEKRGMNFIEVGTNTAANVLFSTSKDAV